MPRLVIKVIYVDTCWIHIVVGAWLALVNFMPILPEDILSINNVVIGIIVSIYNAYMLLAKSNTDVANKN